MRSRVRIRSADGRYPPRPSRSPRGVRRGGPASCPAAGRAGVERRGPAEHDPLYDIAEEDLQGHTFHEEHWFLYSFIPRTAPLATVPEGAAGMSVDRAWAVVPELGYARLVQRALQYAWDKGVVVVMASNDFKSADHQSGMCWPRVWPGNALVADTTGFFEAGLARLTVGFCNRSNYMSFGPHSLFSMPTNGGTTSEATPTQGRGAALFAAYGRRAADEGRIERPLDAGEIKQVLREASSPMTSLTEANYPGRPDATVSLHYGYGRPNVDRALDAVLADHPAGARHPGALLVCLCDPDARCGGPHPGRHQAPRAHRFEWSVEWALGAEPAEAVSSGWPPRARRAAGCGAAWRRSTSSGCRGAYGGARSSTATTSARPGSTPSRCVYAPATSGMMGEDRRTIEVSTTRRCGGASRAPWGWAGSPRRARRPGRRRRRRARVR
jgi:hypothetical protein